MTELRVATIGNKCFTVGKLYHFGHTLESAQAGSKIGTFTAYNFKKKLFQCTSGLGTATPAYRHMVEIPEGLLGKIEDKPIQLEDGSFYLVSLKITDGDNSKFVVEYMGGTEVFENHDCSWTEYDLIIHSEMGRVAQ